MRVPVSTEMPSLRDFEIGTPQTPQGCNVGSKPTPKKGRNAFDLHTGDKIEFVLEKEGAITLRSIKKSVDDVFGRLFNPAATQTCSSDTLLA